MKIYEVTAEYFINWGFAITGFPQPRAEAKSLPPPHNSKSQSAQLNQQQNQKIQTAQKKEEKIKEPPKKKVKASISFGIWFYP